MSFKSNDNKALLWNLLSQHPNQKKNPKKFQAVLEYRINEIYTNRFKYGNNLMTMNKEIIKKFAQEIPPKTKTIEKISTVKQSILNKRLKDQQENFNHFIQKNKPKEIDFSENTDEEPIDFRIVDDTMQKRELELKKIMSHYNKQGADKWLEGKQTSTSKNLKIDKTTNVEIDSDIVNVTSHERRVRFNVEEKQNKNTHKTQPNFFLERLKKIDVKDEIINHLKRIEEKQDKIMSLLETTHR